MSDIKALSYVCAGGYLYAGFYRTSAKGKKSQGIFAVLRLTKTHEKFNLGRTEDPVQKAFSLLSVYAVQIFFYDFLHFFSLSPSFFTSSLKTSGLTAKLTAP